MNLRQYLPTIQERGSYTGPLSTFAEYHSLGIGFIAALAGGDVFTGAVGYALGTGGGKARRSGHMQDAAQEPAYLAVGAALAFGVRALGLAP